MVSTRIECLLAKFHHKLQRGVLNPPSYRENVNKRELFSSRLAYKGYMPHLVCKISGKHDNSYF